MITVAILINAEPILARSATRVKDNPDGTAEYLVDDGTKITFNPDDGAVSLAHKLLDTIHEQR